jgi:8-oxo-dGTP diphosphatase
VIDSLRRVLIAQRPLGKHLAGGWEFPGGKLRPKEDRRVGLARELREELGITIETPRPLMRLRHTYSYGEVLLDMWVVRHYAGSLEGLDGQALRWCTQDELKSVELLPADAPIVKALRLPERLSLATTPDYTVGGLGDAARDGRLRGVLCAGITEAIAGSDAGADFLVLRDGVSHDDIAEICELISVPAYAPRRLAIEDAWTLGATGISELQL